MPVSFETGIVLKNGHVSIYETIGYLKSKHTASSVFNLLDYKDFGQKCIFVHNLFIYLYFSSDAR